MLQGLNLPFIDTASLENSLNATPMRPAENFAPDIAFADIFRMAPVALPELPHEGGIALPQSGNALPPLPADTPIDVSIDVLPADDALAINIVPPMVTALADRIPVPLDVPAPLAGTAVAPPAAPPPAALIQALQVGGPGVAEPVPVAPIADGPLATAPAPGTPAPASPPAALPIPLQAAPVPATPELPPSPLAAEAASRLLEQSVPSKRLPRIEPDATVRGARDARSDDRPQAMKPLPLSPVANQSFPATPVVTQAADSLPGQAVSIGPLQTAQVLNRSAIETLPAPPAPLATIETPVDAADWGDRVGDRLLFMAGNKLQAAEIRLTPAELGPLRVRISIEDGAANVTFHAQHALTREALDQAMPRLRELFAENGLTLNQGDIADADANGVHQGKQEQGKPSSNQSPAMGADADEAIYESDSMILGPQPRPDKLVDTFA